MAEAEGINYDTIVREFYPEAQLLGRYWRNGVDHLTYFATSRIIYASGKTLQSRMIEAGCPPNVMIHIEFPTPTDCIEQL